MEYEKMLELYDQLISAHPEIERKGATVPYTSLNGNMFTMLSKDGTVGIRLSEEEREKFVRKFKTKPYRQYGAVLKEYVHVPEELLKNTKEMKKYLDLSYAYAKTLKKKPTTKKK